MTIVIVGGGAIGLQVAGRLAHADVPSALLGRGTTIKSLAKNSLQLRFPNETYSVRISAVSTIEELPSTFRQPTLAILCVKSYDTPGAITTLRALKPDQILTLQNGLGNEEQLAAVFGAERVIAGAITTSVEPTGPAEITITKLGGIGLAPMVLTSQAKVASTNLLKAGFPVVSYHNYRSLKWSKALLNILGNAQAAILDLPVPAIYAQPQLLDLDLRAARETLAVMAAIGAQPLNLPGYPAGTIATLARFVPDLLLRPLLRRLVGGGRGGKDPSLLRDLRAGRPRSEGEQLYGAIAAEALRQGVPAPINAGLWRILGSIVRGEVAWDQYRGQPERLLADLTR
ncbi:MAG: ketopantoate reductase family protein [Oscillochloridaceae bacterium umkhey_bin13]